MEAEILLRKVLCLFFTISLLASLLGCGDEEDEQEPPRVTYVKWCDMHDLREADLIPVATINVGFSKAMGWVEVDVSGAKGTTHLNRDKAEWVPHWPTKATPYDMLTQPADPCYSPISEGSHTLMITGRDKSGQELEGFEPINFTVLPPECDPPGIYGSECDPRDGATNVDPQRYREKIEVEFDEPMQEVRVFSTEPEFPYTAELAPDKRTLVISFADGYTMPAGTRFCIQLVGSDMAGIMFGNWPEPEEYSFTTK